MTIMPIITSATIIICSAGAYTLVPYEASIQTAVANGMTVEEALNNSIIWTASMMTPDEEDDTTLATVPTDYLEAGHADSYGYAQVFSAIVEAIPFTNGVVDWESGTDFVTVSVEDAEGPFSSFALGRTYNSVEIDGEKHCFDVYGYDSTGNTDYVQCIEVWSEPIA